MIEAYIMNKDESIKLRQEVCDLIYYLVIENIRAIAGSEYNHHATYVDALRDVRNNHPGILGDIDNWVDDIFERHGITRTHNTMAWLNHPISSGPIMQYDVNPLRLDTEKIP